MAMRMRTPMMTMGCRYMCKTQRNNGQGKRNERMNERKNSNDSEHINQAKNSQEPPTASTKSRAARRLVGPRLRHLRRLHPPLPCPCPSRLHLLAHGPRSRSPQRQSPASPPHRRGKRTNGKSARVAPSPHPDPPPSAPERRICVVFIRIFFGGISAKTHAHARSAPPPPPASPPSPTHPSHALGPPPVVGTSLNVSATNAPFNFLCTTRPLLTPANPTSASRNAACSSCGSEASSTRLIFACVVCVPKNCTFVSSCASSGTIRPHAAGVRYIARSADWRDCKAGRSEAA
jgi:hypothetical protein